MKDDKRDNEEGSNQSQLIEVKFKKANIHQDKELSLCKNNETNDKLSVFSESDQAQLIQQSLQGNHLENYNHRSLDLLAKEQLQLLKVHKKQSYENICHTLVRTLNKQSEQFMIVKGERQSGKKTLLFLALQQLKKHEDIRISFFEMSTNIQNTIRLLKISCQFLKKSKDLSNLNEQKCQVLVISDFQIFVYAMKKYHFSHQFKCILRKAKVLFIFLDKAALNEPKQSWIQDHAQTVIIPANTPQFISAAMLQSINNSIQGSFRWSLPLSLANYFVNKLTESNNLSLDVIVNLKKHLSKNLQQTDKEAKSKVTRQLLQNFRKQNFSMNIRVSIQELVLQEKIVLTACWSFLKENQQLTIPLSQLWKRYGWACKSLSLDPVPFKQYKDNLIVKLELYKLVKVLKRSSKQSKIQKNVLLLIDIDEIQRVFSRDFLLSKFFI